jgi:5-hydroxyisourate hydrolase
MSTVTTISTHVLDTSLGTPAANIAVVLERIDGHGMATPVSSYVTNDDGRVGALTPTGDHVSGGSYRLTFDVAGYFAQTMRKSFYTEICINFEVGDVPQHYHVPLLLSPFGYSTYRGS